MKVTLDLPEELLAYLPGEEAGMADVISAGLRVRQGRIQHEAGDIYGVIELLSGLPSPQEVLALHAPQRVVERGEELAAKSRECGLNRDEQAEWDEMMHVEHLVRIAKAKALLKIQADPGAA
jgi:hypothetical protein